MRKTIASFVLAASLAAVPSVARAIDQGEEVGFSTLAALSNILYTPAKVVVAAIGLPVGAVAGFLTGGDTRSAYAFWVPTAGGRYFLTADAMDGRAPVEFFGDDYADRPSMYDRTHHGSAASDAMYVKESMSDADWRHDYGDRPCGERHCPH
jgi:hypothetical protein